MTNRSVVDLGKHAFIQSEIVGNLGDLPRDRLVIISEFIQQVAEADDPDVIRTFLAWRADARLDTLLHLAANLDEDALDQLLFTAEDMLRPDSD